MIEFGGEKIGHPWHGLYRADIEKIVTPAGGNIDPPGAVPDSGDCYLVQIPGMPVPETTPAEAAGGQTWLNYALVSDGRVYGKDIGQGLYIDAAGRAWRLTIWLGGSRASKTITATVQATRFGEIGSGSATSVTRPEMSVTFDTNPDYPAFSGETTGAFLLDVALNGTKFLVGIRRRRGFSAVAEVTLSGSPADGSFSSSMALLADESTIDDWSDLYSEESSGQYYLGVWREIDWSAPPSPFPSGDFPSTPGFYYDIDGVYTAFNGTSYSTGANYWLEITTGGTEPTLAGALDDGYLGFVDGYRPIDIFRPDTKWLAGARYGIDWTAELFTASVGMRADYDPPVFDDTPIYLAFGAGAPSLSSFGLVASSGTCAVTCRTKAADTVIDASEQVVVTETPGDDVYTMTLSRNGSFVSSVSYAAPDGSGYAYWRFGGAISPVSFITSSASENNNVGVRRVSNSIYQSAMPGLVISTNPGSPISLVSAQFFSRYAGRLSVAEYSGFYATEHPVTGVIAQGSNVVCWV